MFIREDGEWIISFMLVLIMYQWTFQPGKYGRRREANEKMAGAGGSGRPVHSSGSSIQRVTRSSSRGEVDKNLHHAKR